MRRGPGGFHPRRAPMHHISHMHHPPPMHRPPMRGPPPPMFGRRPPPPPRLIYGPSRTTSFLTGLAVGGLVGSAASSASRTSSTSTTITSSGYVQSTTPNTVVIIPPADGSAIPNVTTSQPAHYVVQSEAPVYASYQPSAVACADEKDLNTSFAAEPASASAGGVSQAGYQQPTAATNPYGLSNSAPYMTPAASYPAPPGGYYTGAPPYQNPSGSYPSQTSYTPPPTVSYATSDANYPTPSSYTPPPEIYPSAPYAAPGADQQGSTYPSYPTIPSALPTSSDTVNKS